MAQLPPAQEEEAGFVLFPQAGEDGAATEHDDPEASVKRFPKDARRAAIQRVGKDTWKQMSWDERLTAMVKKRGSYGIAYKEKEIPRGRTTKK